MAMGSLVYFAESLEKLGENLARGAADVFIGVPRVWEKIQAKMLAAGAQAPPLARRSSAWARKTGLAGGYAEQRGEARPLLYAGREEARLRQGARRRLGLDRARICVTSAAPISKDTLEFFLALGIPILEVYGMSECTGPGDATRRPTTTAPASAGCVLPGAELKHRRGRRDLHARQARLQGLLKDPEATKNAIDAEGWLHSGDIGDDRQGWLSRRSPIARRICSSPRAARTSRPRCSKGSSRRSRRGPGGGHR